MIVRFRGKDGNYRVQIEQRDDFRTLSERLLSQLPSSVVADSVLVSDQPVGHGKHLADLFGQTISDLNLKHGDLLFLSYSEGAPETAKSAGLSPPPTAVRLNGRPVSDAEARITVPVAFPGNTGSVNSPWENVVQESVDTFLDSQTGKIPRKRDPKMCKHSEKGMCDYCMPLEPFDSGYLKDHGIKFMSFHSYIRKLNSSSSNANAGTAAASSFVPPLSEADFRVKTKCPSGHAPWPAGICSKCQPSAITLQQQPFRMVDHVEFANSEIVNTFIDNWRRTGNQAIGYLYGRYEPYSEVPLGTKAVVEAIYEPPQVTAIDGVTLTLPWEGEAEVDAAAATADAGGLKKVGVIFTDLMDAGKGDGTVVCKRHADSYFLSSLEIVFAAMLQQNHPSSTRWSDSGKFSSKFVTCVISGNVEGQIEISAYQVSNTAEAMVQADIIEPSVSPGLMLVKDATDKRYVPDVFFRRVNEYNAAVQENAKPVFPVEYLLVTLSHGFPAL
ncbi:NPL4 family-domain-containing protein [Lipomyces tetrasporus]|uniref:Nuclear protein localization protein 4 n=1 Tax=Lipomyces tetrasporus TaxID=54092 RepID=A0AAD7VSQ2_9ASCO|nr:NPL4 family-domain-containing protein [Lipomyces tetrasporus]KAJ8100583.1 NPL4 family-domain-containing protein [Lipomyces tetrasporus]